MTLLPSSLPLLKAPCLLLRYKSLYFLTLQISLTIGPRALASCPSLATVSIWLGRHKHIEPFGDQSGLVFALDFDG